MEQHDGVDSILKNNDMEKIIKPKHMEKHNFEMLEMNLQVVMKQQLIYIEKPKLCMKAKEPMFIMNTDILPNIDIGHIGPMKHEAKLMHQKVKLNDIEQVLNIIQPKLMLKEIMWIYVEPNGISFENQMENDMIVEMLDIDMRPKEPKINMKPRNIRNMFVKDKPHTNICTHKASTIVKYSPLLRNIRFAPFSKYNVSG